MRNYKNMTQEKLEEELVGIIKSNLENGVVLLDHDFNIKKITDLPEVEKIEGMDEMITIMRSMYHIPNMRKYFAKDIEKQILIKPYDKTFKPVEPVYTDFISRPDFINRTGIFVSPSYYGMIYDAFKESGVAVDEFIRDYEEKYSTCIIEEPLSGTLKYEVQDDDVSCIGIHDEFHDPSIWEILNSLLMAQYGMWKSKDEITQKLLALLKKVQKTNEELVSICNQYQMLSKEPDAMIH